MLAGEAEVLIKMVMKQFCSPVNNQRRNSSPCCAKVRHALDQPRLLDVRSTPFPKLRVEGWRGLLDPHDDTVWGRNVKGDPYPSATNLVVLPCEA